MEKFLFYLKTDFIKDINQTFFQEKNLIDMEEFFDSKHKRLSIMFQYSSQNGDGAPITFFLSCNKNNYINISVLSSEKLERAVFENIHSELLQAAKRFSFNGFFAATTNDLLDNNERFVQTELVSVGEKAKRMKEILDIIDESGFFYLLHNEHYFEIKSNSEHFSSYLEIDVEKEEILFVELEKKDGEENYVYKYVETIDSKEKLITLLTEIKKEVEKIESLYDSILKETSNLYDQTFIEKMDHGGKRLVSYGEGIGIFIELKRVKKRYHIIVWGKKFKVETLTDVEIIIKKELETIIKKRRLLSIFNQNKNH